MSQFSFSAMAGLTVLPVPKKAEEIIEALFEERKKKARELEDAIRILEGQKRRVADLQVELGSVSDKISEMMNPKASAPVSAPVAADASDSKKVVTSDKLFFESKDSKGNVVWKLDTAKKGVFASIFHALSFLNPHLLIGAVTFLNIGGRYVICITKPNKDQFFVNCVIPFILWKHVKSFFKVTDGVTVLNFDQSVGLVKDNKDLLPDVIAGTHEAFADLSLEIRACGFFFRNNKLVPAKDVSPWKTVMYPREKEVIPEPPVHTIDEVIPRELFANDKHEVVEIDSEEMTAEDRAWINSLE